MRLRSRRALSLFLALPIAAADSRYEAVEPCMGTLFRITLYAPDAERAKHAFQSAFAIARRLDASFSDYLPNSELNQLCRRGEGVVSRELFDVLRLALRVAGKTGGAFDPTAGPAIGVWREARARRTTPDREAIAAAQLLMGWKKIALTGNRRHVRLASQHMQIDLGGIGKGYAAATMLDELRSLGVRRALVAASGDLAIGDAPPGTRGWRIRLGAGGNVEQLRNCGVSTSGDTEQYVELDGVRYSHIIDPRSGWALRNSQPVTVVAKTAWLSDALATALSVDPQLPLERLYGARIIR